MFEISTHSYLTVSENLIISITYQYFEPFDCMQMYK